MRVQQDWYRWILSMYIMNHIVLFWKYDIKLYIIYIYTVPVVPARGGAEVALGLYELRLRLFRQNLQAPCASEAGACVLCANPRTWPAHRKATLCAPNCTLHTSSHLISSHLTCHLSFLHSLHLIRTLSFHRSSSWLISALLCVIRLLLPERSFYSTFTVTYILTHGTRNLSFIYSYLTHYLSNIINTTLHWLKQASIANSTIELRATATEIVAPKPDLGAKAKNRFWSTFWTEFKKKNHKRQNWENLLTNQYHNLDAATPIRFTMPSCKIP